MLHYYVLKFVSCHVVCAWGNENTPTYLFLKKSWHRYLRNINRVSVTKEPSEATAEAKTLKNFEESASPSLNAQPGCGEISTILYLRVFPV